MSMSNAYELTVLDVMVGKSPNLSRTIKLFTTSPTDADSGTEVTGTGYAAFDTNASGADFNAAAAGAVTNANAITYPNTAGNGGQWSSSAAITHFGLYTNDVADTLLAWGALDVSKIVASSSDSLEFPAASLSFTLD
jgi:hypothetical protein